MIQPISRSGATPQEVTHYAGGLIFVSAVLFSSVGCGDSEALPSADIVPTPETQVSPPSTNPQADLAILANRNFADAFNKYDWTAASRFVLPVNAGKFRDGVKHAAQNQAQLQLGGASQNNQLREPRVRRFVDGLLNMTVRYLLLRELGLLRDVSFHSGPDG